MKYQILAALVLVPLSVFEIATDRRWRIAKAARQAVTEDKVASVFNTGPALCVISDEIERVLRLESIAEALRSLGIHYHWMTNETIYGFTGGIAPIRPNWSTKEYGSFVFIVRTQLRGGSLIHSLYMWPRSTLPFAPSGLLFDQLLIAKLRSEI